MEGERDFLAYMKDTGVEKALWKLLIEMDSMKEKPENPVEYMRQNFDPELSAKLVTLKKDIRAKESELTELAEKYPDIYKKCMKKNKKRMKIFAGDVKKKKKITSSPTEDEKTDKTPMPPSSAVKSKTKPKPKTTPKPNAKPAIEEQTKPSPPKAVTSGRTKKTGQKSEVKETKRNEQNKPKYDEPKPVTGKQTKSPPPKGRTSGHTKKTEPKSGDKETNRKEQNKPKCDEHVKFIDDKIAEKEGEIEGKGEGEGDGQLQEKIDEQQPSNATEVEEIAIKQEANTPDSKGDQKTQSKEIEAAVAEDKTPWWKCC